MGMRSLLSDLGKEVRVEMAADATAAIGMVRRQGLGKIRHLAVADLWVQQRISRGDLKIKKIHGRENPADLYTKVLPKDHCHYLMSKLRFEMRSGRAAIAPIRAEIRQPPGGGDVQSTAALGAACCGGVQENSRTSEPRRRS